MERGWSGLPFRPISEFYTQRFGFKTYKVPVSIAGDCPNRRGLKGMKTCSFCDVWGSAAREESFEMPLNEQINVFRERIAKKKNAGKFLVYFQAYTSTFQDLQSLRRAFEQAANTQDVVGFVIGTRPDCVSQGVLDLWQEYQEKLGFIAVEMGVQSFRNDVLEYYRRGHTHEQSLKAIDKIANKTKVDLGIHLIFGAPQESEADFKNAALICNDLPISNVKLHNLHVLKNTHLESLWNQGEFRPQSLEEYAESVRLFLEHLSPRIYIQRLAAYSSRWDELLAPQWTADKMRTHQALVDFLRAKNSVQGLHFQAQTPEDISFKEKLSLRRFKNVTEMPKRP